ncbi:MAG: aminopeptidase [Candidatus Eremiobacter antarcticus]|nr:HEAT repeat domain-containing protein [Candidatus Eremiobacteraeota bacterium]MBC5807881.1 HEAT repeat domain-containing protein [Candidatus Eremiobacteraeota bacterium]PZR62748.1 MAG: aminopeptidase [Candidatus Eremiobacter sp. RRmetagenome_bin22]
MPSNRQALARRSFALASAKPQYAPDRPAAVEHIALVLRFDFEKHILFATCRTTLSAVGKPLHAIEMDCADLIIKSVHSAAGKRMEHETVGGKLHIALGQPVQPGKSTVVVVEYEARQPRQGIYFVSPDEAYPDKPVQVWTQGQDQDAHYWFPCIDYPNAKATTEIIATVPADFFVLSNGVLAEVSADKSSKTKTYHWKMETPHVTYLVSCVAGKFAEHTDMVGRLPVSYYVRPGREEEGARSFGKTPKMIGFFADKLDVPYPYVKYAQIAVADFIFGGMENTTATTQTDTTLHDERAHVDFSSDSLVAHELAHQWFGDLLTCKDWSHAWLNEGFATYFDALFREHDRGPDEFDYYRLQLAARYFEEDSQRYRRPIVTNIYSEPIDLFDRHLYEKGACVLHMVRRMLGDELWWRAIHRYVEDNAYQNVETIDLVRAIEKVTGRNLLPFFDQWIFKAGHPEFKVRYQWDEVTKSVLVAVAQTQETSQATPVFSLPLTVAFGFRQKPELKYQIFCDKNDQTFTFALEQKPDAFYFDPQGDVLKTVELHAPREMLIRQALEDKHLSGRVDAIRALARDSSMEVVDALERLLAGKAFWGVQAEAAFALGKIRTDHAFQALVRARGVAHPKARRAVADALGAFRGDEACDALAPMLRRDESYFVESAAAAGIGKTRSAKAFALLRKALSKQSWNDVVRAGAMRGFGHLGDERAIDICLEWTPYGKPPSSRYAAIEALGKLATGNKAVRERLLELMDDKNFHVRITALDALEELHDRAAIPAIENLAAQDVDGRLKRRCVEAARAIREYQEKPSEMHVLRDEIDSLRETNKTLLDRLERLEAAGKPHANGRSQGSRRKVSRR